MRHTSRAVYVPVHTSFTHLFRQPTTPSTAPRVLTKMEHSPRGFDLPACLRQLLPTAPALHPRDATLSLWAVARLMQRGDVDIVRAWPCVQALCLAVSRRAATLNGDDLSMTLHAASMLPNVPTELDVEALGAATVAAVPTLRLRQLAQALATLAALPEARSAPCLDLAVCEAAMVGRLGTRNVVAVEAMACGVLRGGIAGGQRACSCGDGGGTDDAWYVCQRL